MIGLFVMGVLLFWLMANVPKVIYAIIAIILSLRLESFSRVARAEYTVRIILTIVSFIIWGYLFTSLGPSESAMPLEILGLFCLANIGGFFLLASCIVSAMVARRCHKREQATACP